jgi:two-component system sensor histidine kinase ChiS
MGFQVGANDYVTKPFARDELLARIETHLRLAKITTAYGRFVPHQILKLLSKESIIDIKLGDQIEQEMSLLFADIRSFTSLSEQMSPKENFNFINAYLSRVSPAIRRHDGFIDKYMGDGIMALFPKTANDAVNAAIAMQKEVALYNTHRERVGYEPIRIGIGVHSGRVMLGTVGESERMEGTVIADTVNLTARLEELTKRYGASILISSDTFLALDELDDYDFRFLGKVKVKGKSKTVSIFEVLNGDAEDMIALKIQTKSDFELALILYHQHKLRDAKACFDRVVELNSADEAAKLYSQRIKHLIHYGVPVDWEELEMLMENKVAGDSSFIQV